MRKTTIIKLSVLFLAIIALFTQEERYYFNLDTGEQKFIYSVLYVDVYHKISDTKFSILVKHNNFPTEDKNRWKLHNTFTFWSPNRSPHWRYHGIIDKANEIALVIMLLYQDDLEKQNEIIEYSFNWFPSFAFQTDPVNKYWYDVIDAKERPKMFLSGWQDYDDLKSD